MGAGLGQASSIGEEAKEMLIVPLSLENKGDTQCKRVIESLSVTN